MYTKSTVIKKIIKRIILEKSPKKIQVKNCVLL